MKKILLLVLGVYLFVSCSVFGPKKKSYKPVNEREVPQNYVKDFQNRRKTAELPKWEQVDSVTYNVNFTDNGNKVRMQFTNTSVETYWVVPAEYTPSDIIEYTEKNYVDYKIDEVAIAEIRNKKVYRVALHKKKETKVLEFDITGKFITEVNQ